MNLAYVGHFAASSKWRFWTDTRRFTCCVGTKTVVRMLTTAWCPLSLYTWHVFPLLLLTLNHHYHCFYT